MTDQDSDTTVDEPCTGLRAEIVGLDSPTPLLDGSSQPMVYLDNAATTPPFKHVQAKVDEFLGWYASVHRGAGFKSIVTTEAYEQARAIVAEFVGADRGADCVILVKNATEAINKLAARMPFGPDDVVLSTVMEHHSNDLPWRERAHVEYVGIRADGSLDMDDYAARLERLRGRVKMVTTTGASNVTGFMPPIYDMAEMAHACGAPIMVDCAQLAPHRTIDMGPAGSPRHLDFVALSAHKMYAPFGTGALIGPTDFFRHGSPDYRGGGTIDLVTLDEVHWTDPPERDEAGTPNAVGAVALAAAMRILADYGMENLARHEADLTSYALRRLQRLPEVTVYGSPDPERLADRLGVLTFNVRGLPHGLVAAILGFEGGISVRDGCFCAHPYVLQLMQVGRNEFQTYRSQVLSHDRTDLPGMVRASLGCYNTRADVDRLVAMLERIIAGDYRDGYAIRRATGAYLPRDFDPAAARRVFAL
jgi:cysteine desulfurase / selenocysteine lyase